MYGGGGNDQMDGGAGADTLAGGAGNDTYYVNSAGDVVIEAAGEGVDTVWSFVNAYALTANVENLSFNGIGNFTGVGNALANTIVGSAGDRHARRRRRQRRADRRRWRRPARRRRRHRHRLLRQRLRRRVGGADRQPELQGGDAAGDSYVGVENLAGSAFDDILQGDGQANALAGGEGNDQLMGAGGNDTLNGGAGNDILSGGDGSDRLIGGNGAEVLYGGRDADVFDFDSRRPLPVRRRATSIRSLNGTVLAFEGAGVAGGDRIDLSGIDANSGAGGNQAFKLGSKAAGGLWLEEIGSDTVVYGNVNASGAPEFKLVIEDGALRASDYFAGDFIL